MVAGGQSTLKISVNPKPLNSRIINECVRSITEEDIMNSLQRIILIVAAAAVLLCMVTSASITFEWETSQWLLPLGYKNYGL